MSKKHYRLMAASGLVAAVLLGACSSGSEEAPKAASAAPKAAATEAPKPAATEAPKATAAASTPAAAAAASEVSVTLKEFTFEPSPASVKAGEVTFAAKNAGAAPHELAVVKSDADPKKLPVKDGLMDESASKPLGRTPNLAAGASGTVKVKLEPGKYVLLCNVPGHYSLGMAVPFTVN